MTLSKSNDPVWLITGASSGLGFALAKHVLMKGQRVALTAPRIDSMAVLVDSHPHLALALELDVTRKADCELIVHQVESHFGAIDVLVNNAGIDFLGAIEEQQEADYRAVFEVNFFGAVEMIRRVLPGMRARRRGTIVNISSMDGIASLPVNGYYSASKFALEGLTEALWQEIEPLGLQAIAVELGSFRTGIEQRTRFSGEVIADYAQTSGKFRELMARLTPDMFPGDPARAAVAIFELVDRGSRDHWVVLGSDAQRRIGVKLEQFLREFEAGRNRALSTDYPGSGTAVL